MPKPMHSRIFKRSPSARLHLCRFSEAEVKFVAELVGHTVTDVERELICETLVHHHGSRTQSAKTLNISIRALRNKIREYKACGIIVSEPSQFTQKNACTLDAA